MDEDFDQRDTIFWVLNQDAHYEVFKVLCDILFKLYAPFNYFISNLVLTSAEGSASVHKLIQKDAKWPYINLMIMGLISDHFRSHVFESSTKSIALFTHRTFLSALRRGFYAPAKITDFKYVVLCDQQVFRF